jgi:hypothetical protein
MYLPHGIPRDTRRTVVWVFLYKRMYIQPNSVRVGCNLTLGDKVSPQLMKLCFNIVDLAEGAKWLVNMLSEFVLLCTNDVGSNLSEGKRKNCQLNSNSDTEYKNLILCIIIIIFMVYINS